MPDSTPQSPKLAGGAILGVCLIALCAWFWMSRTEPATLSAGDAPPATPAAPTTVAGLELFSTWPEGQRPELALVLSGQTFGYLSPCGCSLPQKGGLERRANLFTQLRGKGWPVVGIDLGDIASADGVHQQDLMKYATAMTALKEMGYVAVGLGETDFTSQLWDLLSRYALKDSGRVPVILSANLGLADRDAAGRVKNLYSLSDSFPAAVAGGRPMIDAVEVVTPPGAPAIGITAVIGPETGERIIGRDKQFDFARDATGQISNAAIIQAALTAMDQHPARPTFRVLLYGGKFEEAKAAAEAFPQFQLVLCESDSSEPPAFPTPVNSGKTQLVQVGHKGQNVGVLGVFRSPDGFDLKYQLVPLTEDYLTPPGVAAAKKNAVLQLLEGYTKEVADPKNGLMALHVAKQIQHPAQIQNPTSNLHYVGSEACQSCHPAEHTKWASSGHSHAYDALVNKAIRPSNRQFDGECLVCHTVGFRHQTGFAGLEASPKLLHNGCENCHGPGSGHVAHPNDVKYLKPLAPWKQKPEDRLPATAIMEELRQLPLAERQIAKEKLPAGQAEVVKAVEAMCYKCHDTENDPKFDLFEYWPKITHSGLKNSASR